MRPVFFVRVLAKQFAKEMFIAVPDFHKFFNYLTQLANSVARLLMVTSFKLS